MTQLFLFDIGPQKCSRCGSHLIEVIELWIGRYMECIKCTSRFYIQPRRRGGQPESQEETP